MSCTVVEVYVGRELDWSKRSTSQDTARQRDIQSVRQKDRHGYSTGTVKVQKKMYMYVVEV